MGSLKVTERLRSVRAAAVWRVGWTVSSPAVPESPLPVTAKASAEKESKSAEATNRQRGMIVHPRRKSLIFRHKRPGALYRRSPSWCTPINETAVPHRAAPPAEQMFSGLCAPALRRQAPMPQPVRPDPPARRPAHPDRPRALFPGTLPTVDDPFPRTHIHRRRSTQPVAE